MNGRIKNSDDDSDEESSDEESFLLAFRDKPKQTFVSEEIGKALVEGSKTNSHLMRYRKKIPWCKCASDEIHRCKCDPANPADEKSDSDDEDEDDSDKESDDESNGEKARKYKEECGEPWPDEEDRDCEHVECGECGAYRNTDLDDFAGYCVFKGRVSTYYCEDCWQDHADTCRNPECPFALCGHCQVCGRIGKSCVRSGKQFGARVMPSCAL